MSNNGRDHKGCRLYVFAGAKSCEHDMQMVRDLADRIHVPHHCGWRARGRIEGLRNLESFRSRGVKNGRTRSAESPVLAQLYGPAVCCKPDVSNEEDRSCASVSGP